MSRSASPPGSEPSDTVGRRAAPRLRLAIPARFISTDGTHDCVLMDLSSTGARIALAKPLREGAAGYLKIAALELFGEAVWCEHGHGGGVNGLVFDESLAHQQVLAVRHHAETYAERERLALRDQVRRWVTGEG